MICLGFFCLNSKSAYELSSSVLGFSVCWVIEAFTSELICNFYAEQLRFCCLATTSEFRFSEKLFIALIKSTKFPAGTPVPSLLRCMPSWQIKSLVIISFEINKNHSLNINFSKYHLAA